LVDSVLTHLRFRPPITMPGTRLSSIASLVLLVIAACDKGTAPPRSSTDAAETAPSADAMPAAPNDPVVEVDAAAPPTAANDAGAPAAATTGRVTGVIKFAGAAPAMPALDRSRDPHCPQDEVHAPYVTVGAGGALRDAVVHFAPGKIPPRAASGTGATVDQKSCLYKPYVVGVLAGQKIRVKNSDPTPHNVRGMNGDEQLFNEMHIASAPDKLLPVEAQPGHAVQLKCDIHPWMETWVYVSDSPAYAITGADGKFDIGDVPAGSYELEVWHPHLGTKTVKINVKAGETTTATLPAYAPADYKAPQ
jgi:plastocyanin